MRNAITISKITFIESIRGKLFIGLFLFLILFLIFSVYISSLSLGTVARFIENSGMMGVSILCLSITILFGMFTMYQEKDRNELYVLLNRISRPQYLLGRFLGTFYIIFIFSMATTIGIFGLTWILGGVVAPKLFWVVYWALLEFSLLTAVGILFYALNVGFTLNALLILCVYITGHSLTEAVQSFIGLGVFGSKWHLLFVKGVTLTFPNFDLFNFRLAIVHDEPILWGKVILSTAYWFFYLVAIMALSFSVMKKRDI